VEGPQQSLDLAFLVHPQQALAAFIDLVDQGQVLVPPCYGTSSMPIEAMPDSVRCSRPPIHRHLHGPKDLFPAGAKHPCHLLPGHPLGPVRQKPGVGIGEMAFARAPGQRLDLHATPPTAHPPRRVDEKHLDVPQRNELIASRRQDVVTRSASATARAPGPAVGRGMNIQFKGYLASPFRKTCHSITKERGSWG
jgi:hypothetical protein